LADRVDAVFRVDLLARGNADELLAAHHEELGLAVLGELAGVPERQRRGGGAKLRGAKGSPCGASACERWSFARSICGEATPARSSAGALLSTISVAG